MPNGMLPPSSEVSLDNELCQPTLCIIRLDLTVTDSTSGRVMVASMYTESGVGPSFPRTYSQLITSPILELCPAEGDDHESLEPVVE